jgi:hypothetical protein
MPSECASIGDNPGPTDHLYNAGTGCGQVAPGGNCLGLVAS